MTHNDVVDRFHRLKERYDALHRPGATRRLKDDLGLGSGPFNDHLTREEVATLNEELAERLASTTG